MADGDLIDLRAYIAARFDDLKTDLGRVHDRLSTMEGRILTLEESVGSLRGRVDAMDRQQQARADDRRARLGPIATLAVALGGWIWAIVEVWRRRYSP